MSMGEGRLGAAAGEGNGSSVRSDGMTNTVRRVTCTAVTYLSRCWRLEAEVQDRGASRAVSGEASPQYLKTPHLAAPSSGLPLLRAGGWGGGGGKAQPGRPRPARDIGLAWSQPDSITSL